VKTRQSTDKKMVHIRNNNTEEERSAEKVFRDQHSHREGDEGREKREDRKGQDGVGKGGWGAPWDGGIESAGSSAIGEG